MTSAPLLSAGCSARPRIRVLLPLERRWTRPDEPTAGGDAGDQKGTDELLGAGADRKA
jgi:hypothetical protein